MNALRAVFLLGLLGLAFSASIPESRVVGGSVATLGQFPYMASLRTAANFHFCGGSIIASTWVLSAAHCTVGRGNTAVFAVVGTIMRTSGGSTHQSVLIINHPNYNANLLTNDVSVVQVGTPFITSATVRPINIGSAMVGGGLTATVAGWGQTSHPGSAADTLKWLQKTTMTNAQCRSSHNIINGLFVHDNVICTFNGAGQGICMGDSGGPLTLGNDVIGIPSWVIPCANNFPDAYARVSSHRTWILQNTGIPA